MNSPRLLAAIVVRSGLHVQSLGFKTYRPIGCPVESAREFDRWGIDEIVLVLLDEDPVENGLLVERVSTAIAVPLVVVGSIRTVSTAKAFIAAGADKVGFNYCLERDPEVVRDVADLFGEQCVIASIDVVRAGERLLCWRYWDNSSSAIDAIRWLQQVESLGVGEILLNFPERDGLASGMDVNSVKAIVEATNRPVVVLGGIGTAVHAVECFHSAKPSGICVGNRLSHFEHSVILFKKMLADSGAEVRVAVKANYSDCPIDDRGRPTKKPDEFLSELLFLKIEPEVI